MSQEEQRKLAAIMFTDMVGYSALSQRDDKLALELLEEHRALLRKIFSRFHGTEIKTIGDAFLIEFNSALEATQCAIEIQRALGHRNHDVAAERRIELKIGIHIGDVVHRAGDVYGDGVNIASRIEPLAGAGGICVSTDVERQIRNAVETRFEKLAPTELKNISVPMELFRIVLPWERPGTPFAKTEERSKSTSRRFALVTIAIGLLLIGGIGWWWTAQLRRSSSGSAANNAPAPRQSEAATIPEKSIAVLPFESLSEDKSNEYFAEGVQDEILTRLAKVADLKVIARTSTQRFKSVPENLPDIARQLGVLNILEGSVQKVNDQVRVNVQLINAMTEAHLWAEIYDRKLTDIFAVESDIAKTIADTLQAKLTGSEMQAMTNSPTEDPAAHELYLKGRHAWELRGDNLLHAVEFYNQAIARDPSFALAYAGLGETYILLPYYIGTDPKEARPKARAATLKALELNPNLSEAHNALGKIVYTDDIDLQQAIAEHQRAIELSPNNASAHHWIGNGPLAGLGRLDEAIAEGKRSTELDPLSAINLVDLADTYMYARRFKEAEAVMKKALEIDPTFAYAHWIYGILLQVSGDLEGARTQYATARARENDPQAIALRGQLGAIMGRREEAVQALAALEELGKHQYVEAYYRALLYVSLGQKDQAIAALEQGYAERDGDDIGVINVDPLLDPLRGSPRFEALVRQVVSPKQ